MSFALALFAAVAVQKNVRDLAQFKRAEEAQYEEAATHYTGGEV